MRTKIKTNIKGNETIYVKESVVNVHNLLAEKGSFILVRRRKYSYTGSTRKITSERYFSIKKSNIQFVESEK